LSRRELIATVQRGRSKAGIHINAERIIAGLREDPPAELVFRNDHSARCTCLACVADRIGFRRRA
jgi:hypothetical protein